jgi:hypothetical protein
MEGNRIMTVPGQLEDVLRLTDELDAFEAQRDKCLAKASTDPGKAESYDALIAEATAALDAARAAVPSEVLEHIDELRAARERYDKATAKIVDQFPSAGIEAAGAAGGAGDPTVETEEG